MAVTTYRVLATDYDGTLAHDGKVDEATVEAIRRAREHGMRLVMVTGREVPDLSNTFQHLALFDRVVAENGAVLLDPATASLRVIGAPPPPALIARLTASNVPLSVGHSIVATVHPYEEAVRNAIADLGLPWQTILNKGSVMALPAGVSKATGLAAALGDLGEPASDTVGIGDAENDRDFLVMCGLAVAVANALPSVKAIAHRVTIGARGDGVRELIAELTSPSPGRS